MFRARKHSRQQYLMNSRKRGISLTDRRGASRSRTPGALPGIMGEPGAEHTAPQEGRFTVPSQGGILGEAAGRAAGGNPPQGTSRPGKMEAHDQTEPQSQRPCEMAMTAVTGLWGDGDGGGVMGAGRVLSSIQSSSRLIKHHCGVVLPPPCEAWRGRVTCPRSQH